jgi:hypothetical protein
MKRKRYRLKMHVGSHDWLRYGDIYDGETVEESPRRLNPRIRLFKPGDSNKIVDVQSSWVEEVS